MGMVQPRVSGVGVGGTARYCKVCGSASREQGRVPPRGLGQGRKGFDPRIRGWAEQAQDVGPLARFGTAYTGLDNQRSYPDSHTRVSAPLAGGLAVANNSFAVSGAVADDLLLTLAQLLPGWQGFLCSGSGFLSGFSSCSGQRWVGLH